MHPYVGFKGKYTVTVLLTDNNKTPPPVSVSSSDDGEEVSEEEHEDTAAKVFTTHSGGAKVDGNNVDSSDSENPKNYVQHNTGIEKYFLKLKEDVVDGLICFGYIPATLAKTIKEQPNGNHVAEAIAICSNNQKHNYAGSASSSGLFLKNAGTIYSIKKTNTFVKITTNGFSALFVRPAPNQNDVLLPYIYMEGV